MVLVRYCRVVVNKSSIFVVTLDPLPPYPPVLSLGRFSSTAMRSVAYSYPSWE